MITLELSSHEIELLNKTIKLLLFVQSCGVEEVIDVLIEDFSFRFQETQTKHKLQKLIESLQEYVSLFATAPSWNSSSLLTFYVEEMDNGENFFEETPESYSQNDSAMFRLYQMRKKTNIFELKLTKDLAELLAHGIICVISLLKNGSLEVINLFNWKQVEFYNQARTLFDKIGLFATDDSKSSLLPLEDLLEQVRNVVAGETQKKTIMDIIAPSTQPLF